MDVNFPLAMLSEWGRLGHVVDLQVPLDYQLLLQKMDVRGSYRQAGADYR